MYIKFSTVMVQGFQSIDNAIVSFDNQGIVLVRGVNNYDSNALSNGSGKSSIFESIFWAIYGKTSSGITDPISRYSNNGCLVKLTFTIDSQQYTIIRSIKHKIYKTGLKLFKGSDEISGRNKTDTEKMIKQDIMPFDQDIFLSTVFLSQNFSGRLSMLQPGGRKARIETLTNTDVQVEDFKNKFQAMKSKYSGLYDDTKNEESYKQGILYNLNSQIESLESEISIAKQNKPDGDIDTINQTISKLEELLNKLQNTISDYNRNKSSKQVEISNINSQISIINNTIRTETSELDNLIEGKPCPTCGRKTDEAIPQELLDAKRQKIADSESSLEPLRESISTLQSEISTLDEQISMLTNKMSSIQDSIRTNRAILTELYKYSNISDNESKVENLKTEVISISSEILSLAEKATTYANKRDIANHCVSLVSKQFRGYLLQETIKFMNTRLEEYSRVLFSNESDMISLSADASKLDIYLGDALYDTLSGGERKKVDIALVLTQRDLAMNISGMSCNLLILDEILENMDEKATNTTLDLLSQVSSDIESMFIISHNNYSIPYDTIMTVTKGSDRLSTVSYS